MGGYSGDERPEIVVDRVGPVPVITVAGLEFADSTTLHVLLRAREAGELVLVGPPRPQVRLLFQVADLLEAFHFADGLGEAVGVLGMAR